MISNDELEKIAREIPEPKRMIFVPIRQDKFDGHFWMDIGCGSGSIDAVFVKIRRLQETIPDWHANNQVIGIIKCKVEVVHEE